MAARSLSTERFFGFINAAAPSRDAALQRLQTVANLLDSAFMLPGTRQRIGAAADPNPGCATTR